MYDARREGDVFGWCDCSSRRFSRRPRRAGSTTGFCLAFADADAGRDAVSAVAKEFEQGAIYEYYAKDGALYRRTLGVTMEMDETTPMMLVDHEELKKRSTLVQLPWAGPDGFP